MFALEISFVDDPGSTEFLLVRRPRFSIGSRKEANVNIEEMQQLGFDLEISRGLGPSFSSRPLAPGGQDVSQFKYLSNTFSENAAIDLGPVKLKVTALESDLIVRESDTPDKAAARIFRQSLAFETPKFPAWVILGNNPLVFSFSPDQSILIGRSNKCLLRVDAHDVSNEHARLGYESGSFWIEDLGSTNGTFVDGEQVSGRQVVAPETRIMIGGHTLIIGITDKDQLSRAIQPEGVVKSVEPATVKAQFPSIVSNSDLVRPARLALPAGTSVVVGRDPDNDLWIGAPHVSRKHFSVSVSKTGEISVVDMSRNGMVWSQGILPRNQPFIIKPGANIFDLGGGITIALCSSLDEENKYLSAKNSVLDMNTNPIKGISTARSNNALAPKQISSEPVESLQTKTVAPKPNEFGKGKPAVSSRLGWWMLGISALMIGAVVLMLLIHRFS